MPSRRSGSRREPAGDADRDAENPRVFEAGDAFRLLGAVDAEKTVGITTGYERATAPRSS